MLLFHCPELTSQDCNIVLFFVFFLSHLDLILMSSLEVDPFFLIASTPLPLLLLGFYTAGPLYSHPNCPRARY